LLTYFCGPINTDRLRPDTSFCGAKNSRFFYSEITFYIEVFVTSHDDREFLVSRHCVGLCKIATDLLVEAAREYVEDTANSETLQGFVGSDTGWFLVSEAIHSTHNS
jgi:hypothetical protein